MDKSIVRARIEDIRHHSCLRFAFLSRRMRASPLKLLPDGGIPIVEITMTVPGRAPL